ncbi:MULTISPECIES: DUF1254 domain-containing protein [Rhizobium]|uniref:Carboxylesterase n=3 Tax=Rhizobium/Agrobacterium group TaxID=227290 RepID=A0ABR5CND7_9HYPH|nr:MULTISPECIES: DUF1254 domain-containing protein [Rhizobium]KAA3503970.1 DUF1254 domain-containing protein [Rhizobium rhizogenes]KJF66365.1 carboxylesterase [Rhizobium nepotum 39/7]
MKTTPLALATATVMTALVAFSTATAAEQVTIDNFVRAESDLYFGNVVKDGGFGKFFHRREPATIENQTIIRLNRDTLYSGAVFDLEAGPLTITLPDAGKRFMSLLAINEDHYVTDVSYEGVSTFTKETAGTRYMVIAIRTFVDPSNPKDVEQVHALQDAIKIEQPGGPGKFEAADWDAASQKKVRDALLILATTMSDFNKSFGSKDEVDPVRHLVSSAAAWGGNPDKDATYLNVTPDKNDGKTIYKLNVKDVPVEGFWSISLYNSKGYYEKNPYGAYSLNDVTAQKNADGSISVQFGGCDGKIPNCLPIMAGWNYTVRLYRPRESVLDGTWHFPVPQPLN